MLRDRIGIGEPAPPVEGEDANADTFDGVAEEPALAGAAAPIDQGERDETEHGDECAHDASPDEEGQGYIAGEVSARVQKGQGTGLEVRHRLCGSQETNRSLMKQTKRA